MIDPFVKDSFRAAAAHRCPACGYAVFEGEPCAYCLNPHLFGQAAEIQREFRAIMQIYRETMPYRYAGIISYAVEKLRRRAQQAEERATLAETRPS